MGQRESIDEVGNNKTEFIKEVADFIEHLAKKYNGNEHVGIIWSALDKSNGEGECQAHNGGLGSGLMMHNCSNALKQNRRVGHYVSGDPMQALFGVIGEAIEDTFDEHRKEKAAKDPNVN